MLTSSKKTRGLLVIERIQSARTWAAWVVVSSQAKMEAAVTMKSTEAVVSIVSKVACARVLRFMVR